MICLFRVCSSLFNIVVILIVDRRPKCLMPLNKNTSLCLFPNLEKKTWSTQRVNGMSCDIFTLSQCARWNRRSNKCGTGHNKMTLQQKIDYNYYCTIPNQRQNNKSQAAFIGVLISQVKIVYYVACRWSGRPKVYNRSVSSCNVWSNMPGVDSRKFCWNNKQSAVARCMCLQSHFGIKFPLCRMRRIQWRQRRKIAAPLR